MKISELSNTSARILSAFGMLFILGIVVALEYYFPQIHAVRWLGVLIMLGAIYETVKNYRNVTSEIFNKHAFCFIVFFAWLILMLASV